MSDQRTSNIFGVCREYSQGMWNLHDEIYSSNELTFLSLLQRDNTDWNFQTRICRHAHLSLTRLTTQFIRYPFLEGVEMKEICVTHSSFPMFRNFLPNPGRILAALTSKGCGPLYVNADRILLPWFSIKLRNIGKLDWRSSHGFGENTAFRAMQKCSGLLPVSEHLCF